MTIKTTGAHLIEEIISIIETTIDLHNALDLLTDTVNDHSIACRLIMDEIEKQHEALDEIRNRMYIIKDPLK